MPSIDTLGELFLVLLAVAAVGIFAAVVAATLLVMAAARSEDRYETLAGPPPGLLTRLARRLVTAPAAGTGQVSRRISRKLAAPGSMPARAAVRGRAGEPEWGPFLTLGPPPDSGPARGEDAGGLNRRDRVGTPR